MPQRVLLVDNNDSFTYNLAQLLDESGLCTYDVILYKGLDAVNFSAYDKILISPGPGVPSELPVLKDLILGNAGKKSILGVCLGMQAIVEAFGGTLQNLKSVRHGEQTLVNIRKPDDFLFHTIHDPFVAGLYHSWAANPLTFPGNLEISATDTQGVIMAIRHREYDIRGVQFHPESYITECGEILIQNWLKLNTLIQ